MSAPTEAEIRSVIEDRLTRYPSDRPQSRIRDGIEAMADFMYGPAWDKLSGESSRGDAPREWPGDLWDDLRRPEAARLDGAVPRGDRARPGALPRGCDRGNRDRRRDVRP